MTSPVMSRHVRASRCSVLCSVGGCCLGPLFCFTHKVSGKCLKCFLHTVLQVIFNCHMNLERNYHENKCKKNSGKKSFFKCNFFDFFF